MTKASEIVEAFEREAAEWPGVSVSFGRGAKHPFATVSFRGLERKCSFSGTPSDRRSLQNEVRDFRRALRSIGAERRERWPDRHPTVEQVIEAYRTGARA